MKNRFFSHFPGLFYLLSLALCFGDQKHAQPANFDSKEPFHACFLPQHRAFRAVCTEHMFQGDSSLPQVNKKFLIQVHIVRDSLGQTLTDAEISTVRNSVAGASNAFSGISISFETEDSVRVVDNYRFNLPEDTWRLDEMVKNHAVEDRINLFVFDAFVGVLEGAAGIASGESMFLPYASLENSGTVTHELGHVFGLAHTFGSGDVIAAAQGEPFDVSTELVDGSNCETAGDQVCDTPADPCVPNDPMVRFGLMTIVFTSTMVRMLMGIIMSQISTTSWPTTFLMIRATATVALAVDSLEKWLLPTIEMIGGNEETINLWFTTPMGSTTSTFRSGPSFLSILCLATLTESCFSR